MTEFQPNLRENRRPKPSAFGLAALLCLSLMALLVAVQVAHFHPVGDDADHCQLCIAMHSAVPVEVIAAVVVLVRIRTVAPVFQARPVVRYWHPKLFTRPPPAGC